MVGCVVLTGCVLIGCVLIGCVLIGCVDRVCRKDVLVGCIVGCIARENVLRVYVYVCRRVC